MSGGPPPPPPPSHNPHGRQAPPPNSAWNHLQCVQVPNYYPTRQPQHAHMSSEFHPHQQLHSLPHQHHQPTWHTPTTTTEPAKGGVATTTTTPHNSPLFNLQQMLGTSGSSSERSYATARHSPGVDLTLQRNGNGNQNGDVAPPQSPISLSVRDTRQINSLALDGELDRDRANAVAVELVAKAPNASKMSPNVLRRLPAPKRVDSIIDRLNTSTDKQQQPHQQSSVIVPAPTTPVVIAVAASSHDESSNSSQGATASSTTAALTITTIPTITMAIPVSATTQIRDDNIASPLSNDDSLDGNSKSRRKRKPSKTVKVSKDDELSSDSNVGAGEPTITATAVVPQAGNTDVHMHANKSNESCEHTPTTNRRRSSSEPAASPIDLPDSKISRRKTVSESETLDIATAGNAAAIKSDESADITANQENALSTLNSAPVSVIMEHSNSSQESGDTKVKQDEAIVAEEKPANEEEKTVVNDEGQPEESLTQKKPSTEAQSFVAVEDELEKMFAGIGDSESSPVVAASTLPADIENEAPYDLTPTANTPVSKVNGSSLKRGRPKGSKASSRRPSDANSVESAPTPRKKHKTNKKRDEANNGGNSAAKKNRSISDLLPLATTIRDTYDSGSNASSSRSRGPFVQIKGPRDSPISVSIVNAPSGNQEDEGGTGGSDKLLMKVNKHRFHDDSEYRHKVRSKGLHCSTLSTKYDAQTRDASWICVFCKRGPHATDPLLPGPSPFTLDTPRYSPGDLFGPYVITTDCPEYQRRLDDPFDLQFKSKLLRQGFANVSPLNKRSKKRQNSGSFDGSSGVSNAEADSAKDVMLGIAEVTASTYEVWVHEDCVTWGPGVYLIGPKIIGLEGAVWSACVLPCNRCGLRGASVCCLKRGCALVMHIGCAKLAKWKLDEHNYKSYCVEHSLSS